MSLRIDLAAYRLRQLKREEEERTAKATHTPEPWTMEPCHCGDIVCKQWFVSITGSDGRVSEPDGRLIIAVLPLKKALEDLMRHPHIRAYLPYNPKDETMLAAVAALALARKE